jgi:hypothetical protein
MDVGAVKAPTIQRSYPTEPLVSYQINRQLSGWNLPPLVIRTFGAHCQQRHLSSRAAVPQARGRSSPELIEGLDETLPHGRRAIHSASSQSLLKEGSL